MKLLNRIENNIKSSSSINNKINRAVDFAKVLEKIEFEKNLKLSVHAVDRLKQRNIILTEKDMTVLKSAVEKIRNKGGKEALIYYNNIAFVTSIKNNTIITAVDDKNLKENVFTNIDSAIIL